MSAGELTGETAPAQEEQAEQGLKVEWTAPHESAGAEEDASQGQVMRSSDPCRLGTAQEQPDAGHDSGTGEQHADTESSVACQSASDVEYELRHEKQEIEVDKDTMLPIGWTMKEHKYLKGKHEGRHNWKFRLR